MNILAFDTCFAACSVAVGKGLGTGAAETFGFFEPMETGHAERLMPMVAEAMSAARLAFAELDRIAVTIGPGSFTGTRIAVAAARGFGLAAGRARFVTASSLAVMAERASGTLAAIRGSRLLAVVVDARRGEVYAQLFASDGAEVQELGPPEVLAIEDAARIGGAEPIVLVGSGAVAVAEIARRNGRPVDVYMEQLLPAAGDLLSMAMRLPGSAERPSPLYLRPADAKPQTGKSIERARS